MSDDADQRARARVGDVLNDKWTLERLIGVGGMGAVYAGLHRNGARAAVKVLHRYLANHEDIRARFLREGYAANRVEHPSVVKVLDDDIVRSGPDEGTAYLVMELLDGESLESRSNRGLEITEREFLTLAEVVLEVLEVAHANGVVHRDIKPDNIFVTNAGAGVERIKVLDFGLARLLEGQSTTVHGMALGTPSFMSPEQAAGRNDEIDGRTDIFALAATGFRLITGRRIHDGANSVELVMKMANLPAPRVHTVAPEVSEALARVLDRALEFRREDRYESASAMRSDVQNALAALDMGLNATVRVASPLDKSVELSGADIEVVSAPNASPASTTREAGAVAPAPPAPVEALPAPPAETVSVPAELPPPTRPQLQPTETEESLSPVPMQRSSFVPAIVGLAIVAVGAGGAYAAGWFSDAPPPPTSVASSEPVTAVPDASTEPSETPEASVAVSPGNDAAPPRPPKPRSVPAKRPAKPPWKPTKRPKH